VVVAGGRVVVLVVVLVLVLVEVLVVEVLVVELGGGGIVVVVVLVVVVLLVVVGGGGPKGFPPSSSRRGLVVVVVVVAPGVVVEVVLVVLVDEVLEVEVDPWWLSSLSSSPLLSSSPSCVLPTGDGKSRRLPASKGFEGFGSTNPYAKWVPWYAYPTIKRAWRPPAFGPVTSGRSTAQPCAPV